MMVRPQDITLQHAESPLPVDVRQRMFLGDAIDYVVALGAQSVRVRAGSHDEFMPGERVYMTISEGHFFA